MKNLTFGELLNLVPATKDEKLPTIAQLRNRSQEEILIQDMGITVFKDGFYLYSSGCYSTVFAVDRCMGIPCEVSEGEGETARNRTISISEKECRDMDWIWPLMVMGSRRLDHNQEERENSRVGFRAGNDGNDWDSAFAVADFTDLLMEEEEEANLHNRLNIALEHLPIRQREAVNLYFYKNMKQEDVAAAMGVSQPCVVKLLKAAYANLKKEI